MDQIDLLLTNLYRLRATVQQILSDDASSIFNLPGGTGDRSAREAALSRALKRGIVSLKVGNDQDLETMRYTNRKKLLGNLPGTAEVGLTEKGGVLWERRARPVWDLFVQEGDPRVVRGEVWISFEARSRSWLANVDHTLQRLGFYRQIERRIVIRRPWSPLYWKRFDSGHILEVNTRERAETERGERFLEGIAVADERLDSAFSVFARMWDARWLASMR